VYKELNQTQEKTFYTPFSLTLGFL